MARELILKLGKKITDRVDVKLGMTQLDETSPEYYGLASVVTDEMAELALAMKVRVPTTPAEMSKKTGKDPVYIEQLFDQMSMIGLLEYNWENADHHKQWTLPIFVPGSAELMNMNLPQVEEHPEIAQFFERTRQRAHECGCSGAHDVAARAVRRVTVRAQHAPAVPADVREAGHRLSFTRSPRSARAASSARSARLMRDTSGRTTMPAPPLPSPFSTGRRPRARMCSLTR